MSRTRKTLVIITGTILLLIVLFFIVLATFDWNRLKPTINQKVSAELNRPFAIRGDLGVVWERQPEERAGAAGSRGPMCTRKISCWATRRPFPR
ncbi:AsmA family protein [Klebsiella quasipneumoniae]|uniref:AsmA family protein n=1 Tax=Klebsiella quasipneumoniae TaxID=1463165 RepID=UPI003EC9E892